MKGFFIMVFMFVAIFSWAQWSGNDTNNIDISNFGGARNIGKGDVWYFDPADIVEDGEYVEVYFTLDFNASRWIGFIPKDEGLLEVGMMFEFNKHDLSEAYFMFAYKSEYDLQLDNYIIVITMNGDKYMMGGQSNDETGKEYHESDDEWFCATGIYLSNEWAEWFVDNTGGSYTFSIIEYNYGDNLWFKIPEEFFNILHQVYTIYTK